MDYATYNAARETSQGLRFTQYCLMIVEMRIAEARALFGNDTQPMSKDQLYHRRMQGFRLNCAVKNDSELLAPEDWAAVDEALDGLGLKMDAVLEGVLVDGDSSQLYRELQCDRFLFGSSFEKVHADGRRERVHPKDVYIDIDGVARETKQN